LQATWGLEGVTCEEAATKLNDQTVNNTLARAVIADFQAALNLAQWPEAAKTVVAVRQPCLTSNVSTAWFHIHQPLPTTFAWQR
jgi:hypothetical protein